MSPTNIARGFLMGVVLLALIGWLLANVVIVT